MQIEPLFYAVREQFAPDEEKKNARRHGKEQKGENEFRLKLCSDYFALALIVKLDKVPGDEDYKKNKQNKDQVEQTQHRNIVSDRSFYRLLLKKINFKRGENNQGGKNGKNTATRSKPLLPDLVRR